MTTLFLHGTVYTGGGLMCEAFAVENGKILAVGSDTELSAAYPDAEKADLHGRFVCPGFHDSHMHVLSLGALLSRLDLSARTSSLADMLSATTERLHEIPSGGWLIGRGWNHDYFTDEHRLPDRDDLDGVSREVPIQLTRACGHICVVNSRALLLAGVTRDTPDPVGGTIDRDESGEPTGILRENAIDLITNAQPQPDTRVLKQYLSRALDKLACAGITAVQTDDFSLFPAVPFEEVIRAYTELETEGALPVRVYEQAWLPTQETLERFLAAGLRTGAGTDLFRIGPLKLIADGSLGARTAYLNRPYADDPSTCGIPIYSRYRLNRLITAAHEAGMQIAVHTIGDGALDMVLDALEEAYGGKACPEARDGIVHCQITRPEQLERMRRLGILAYIQPIFLDYDTQIVNRRVGDELASTSYAFKTLYDTCRAAFGSDCPVEKPDPLRGVQCAVTRAPLNSPELVYRPEEAFTVSEALDGFTSASAYTCFAEDRLGALRPGMAADFVVLSADPLQVRPSRISEIRVLETRMGGRRTYIAPGPQEVL